MWSAAKLRDKIEEQGRTTKWLANECSITIGTLHSVLSGRKPGKQVSRLLAIALGCAPEDLDLSVSPDSGSED